jgi:hypothetical protein
MIVLSIEEEEFKRLAYQLVNRVDGSERYYWYINVIRIILKEPTTDYNRHTRLDDDYEQS